MTDTVKILIVDDRPENLVSLEGILENRQVAVFRALSGEEALGLTLEHDFALILLDVQMPGMDGFETAEFLRQRRKTRHIPIIFLTAINKETAHVYKGYTAGAVDYIFKPYDPDILRAKVDLFISLFRQRAELEKTTTRLNRMVRELRKSEEKYRLLVENASDAVIILQDDFLKYHNPRTAQIIGYAAEEIAAMRFTEFVHPDDRPIVNRRNRARLLANSPSEVLAFRVIRKDGEERWVEANGIMIIWEERKALLCFIRDITQQRKLEMQLQQSQKMEAIGTLAGGIAHDFNNILGAIIGYTEMSIQEVADTAMGHSQLGAQLGHNLKQVMKASQRAKELVQQILTFSHKRDQKREPVILLPIIKETLKLLRASLPRSIDIRTEFPAGAVSVFSNPTEIHQILMNLCTNAAHAMNGGPGVLTIRLSDCKVDGDRNGAHMRPLPPGNYARLIVQDTGTGMDEITMKKIFDPYFTTKEAGKGTGMGLSVVHAIVRSMKGAVSVDSAPGKGATFEILMPRHAAQGTAEEACRVPLTLPESGKQVLLVDDEPSLIDIGEQMLRRLGCEVACMEDPVEAVRRFESQPFAYDLVITDMSMPRMNGDHLARRIMDIRPDVPIILCTGYNDRMSEESARELGIRCFLMKPLTMEVLARALQTAFSAASAKVELSHSGRES